MPTAAEFQALADELRQLGAVIVQAANLGDQELALWAVGALSSAAARPAWWAREAADNEAAAIAAAAIERAQRGWVIRAWLPVPAGPPPGQYRP